MGVLVFGTPILNIKNNHFTLNMLGRSKSYFGFGLSVKSTTHMPLMGMPVVEASSPFHSRTSCSTLHWSSCMERRFLTWYAYTF